MDRLDEVPKGNVVVVENHAGIDADYVPVAYANLLLWDLNRAHARLREAELVLRTIAEMPMREQDNMISAAMRTAARAYKPECPR